MNTLVQPDKSSPKAEQGQSLVEFALVAVLLLIIVAGIVDLGRLFYTWIALREAAQEGAVFGAICPDGFLIDRHVRNSSYFPVDLSDTSQVEVSSSIVEPGEDSDGLGTVAYVQVTYKNFRFGMPFLSAILGTDTIEISATANDLVLQKSCPDS